MPIVASIASGLAIACEKNFNEFLKTHSELDPEDESSETYNVPVSQALEYRRLRSQIDKSHAGAAILPQSFIVSLVTQYDAFLGGLVRCLYRAKPELLKQSERKLSYSQLHEFADIEQAREYILEKEIENLLRQSHAEQFDTLSSRFDLKLKENLPIWPTFIELTERRNLFVHCSGVVSAQYLSVCESHRVNFNQKPKLGDNLGVSPEYFDSAHACVFQIGAKLAHVLWRKVLPTLRADADGCLNMLLYDLLVNDRYTLAVAMADFALNTFKQHSSDQVRLMMVVNLAQAHKWNGNDALYPSGEHPSCVGG